MAIKNKKLFFSLFALYIAVMLIMCAIGTIPAGSNTWNKGAKIYFPYSEKTTGGQIEIKGSAYSKDGIENIELKIMPENKKVPIEREKIYYQGETILTLSTFSVNVSLEDGDHTLSVIVTDSAGTYEFDKLNFISDSHMSTIGFEMFSLQHIIALALVIILYIAILLLYKKYPTEKTKKAIYALISLCLVFCDISVKIWLLKNGVFKASYDGFLHMCDISGPFLMILFYMKDSKNRQRFFSLMFIWGVLGAAMALLTPEMRGNVFPSLYFMTFFIKHGAIVIGVLILGVIEKYRPKMKHLPIVMAISLVIVAIVYAINRLIVFLPPLEPGNYMFLSYPPTGGSAIDILVDIFGPSPYYIIGMVTLAFVLYTFMWAIYAVIEKVKSTKEK
ncbi:MAG: TIGR02206 family membrane protein [Clostridia bacterium]|nr:TIGR02206 family membrane protein [Clostridia bacterium]